mgnify:FL=1
MTAIDRIGQLDVDYVVTGHGPDTTKKYLAVQRSMLMELNTAVAVAIDKGWSKEETMERVHFKDRYPVDIGQEYMMDYINEWNAKSLYEKLTADS